MAEISRPWTGIVTGDAGPYSADQWQQIYRDYIGLAADGGSDNDAGILYGSGSVTDPGLTVTPNAPAGQSVILTPGAGLVNGSYYDNTASLVLAVGANASGNPRIDTVILRKDWTAQTVRAIVKAGTPAASPVPPSMSQSAGSLWEIPLADLTLANGYSTITATEIVNRRIYKNVAPQVILEGIQNGSGATLNTGDVVVWSTAANKQVTSSALRGAAVAGVWIGRTVNGGYGRVLLRGIGYVRCDSAIGARNVPIIHSASFFGTAVLTNTSGRNAFAVSVETTGAAGLCLCMVDVPILRASAIVTSTYDTPATITSASATFVDVSTANILITFVTNTGNVRVRFTLPIYHAYSSGAGGTMYLNQRIDATTDANGAANGIFAINTEGYGANGNTATQANSYTCEHDWTGLTPGSHTVRLRWRSSANGPTMGVQQYNLGAGHPVMMSAEELG